MTGYGETRGWEKLLLHGEAVHRLRARLAGLLGPLETYAPADLASEQVAASKALHAWPEWRELLDDNSDQLRSVVGDELLHQRKPYLRIARPGRAEDNIGIHRDTHYGASTAEWVLWIPLTEATSGADMRILPGSHREPESAYPWTQEASADVRYGSEKHWLGFRYAPKRMSAEVEARAVPVPCKVGQALLFNSNCVHGQIVNSAPWTRVSIDVRIIEAGADIQMNRGLHGELYEPLHYRQIA